MRMHRPVVTITITVAISLLFLPFLRSQQPYLNNKQLNCSAYSASAATSGNLCPTTNANTSCLSYLTFRSSPPSYPNLVTVSYLLNATPVSALSSLNNFSDFEPLPSDTLLLVPVTCSCSGSFFQHNASYTIKALDTYFVVANDTYQGLTTCQALMHQNPYSAENLKPGDRLNVPLRCACPSANQTARGVRYLVSYLVTWNEDVSKIAAMFGVSEESVLDANELTYRSTIYPFIPLLVPLPHEPTKINLSPPPPPPPPKTAPVPPPSSGGHNKWVFVGVGVGGAVLTVLGCSVFVFCFRKKRESSEIAGGVPAKKSTECNPVLAAVADNDPWLVEGVGVKDAIETLTLYRIEDLENATGFFSEESKIRGSVYLGKFKEDSAAIKVLKGDVSSEINILRGINHSNVIRLSGFCVHQGSTYLVYEYAENGSLSDWLHTKDANSALSWKQRVQIAYGIADALNYLHTYMNPPCIHKNLKSSSVLLDGNFRAKVANFGLARGVEDNEEGGLQLTQHVVGTHGYMAPEYVENGMITPKMDVFAFGVVMLELLSGREATGDSKNREEMLCVVINRILDGHNAREKLEDFIDPLLESRYPLDLVFLVAELAKRCVASDLNARPGIPEVSVILSKILSSSVD